MTEEKSNEVLN